MNSCARASLVTPFGYRPNLTSGGCSCGKQCKGTCNGFIDGRRHENACCNAESINEITNFIQAEPECPEGTIPAIVVEAKTNPLFAGLFSCFDDDVLRNFLCCMAQYAVPGCGDMPVLLAAAHFYTLLSTGQRLGTMTLVTQSEKGKPLELVATAAKDISSNANHWNLSFYGIQYNTMFRRPAANYMGMAWGI